MDELKGIQIHVRVPNLGYEPLPARRTALANALCHEIESAANEFVTYRASCVTLHNVTQLTEPGVESVLKALRRLLGVGDRTFIIAEVSPELLNTNLMTTLRNGHVDWYRLDFGSLNETEKHGLGLRYGSQVAPIVHRMLEQYRMDHFAIGLGMGMPGQTERTCRDCLTKLEDFAPAGVYLTPPADEVRDIAAAIQAAELLEATLLERGYQKRGPFDYVLPAFATHAVATCDDIGETWGFGPGAVSMVNGCALVNVANERLYLKRAGGNVVASATRLNEATQASAAALNGLRKARGVDCAAFEQGHASHLVEAFERLERQGLVRRIGNRLHLTAYGTVLMSRVRRELEV